MAYTTESCTPAELDWSLKQQASLEKLVVAYDIMLNDPYANLVTGGTLEAGVGETIKHTIPGRPVLNQSMTIPAKVLRTSSCGVTGPTAGFGSNDYETKVYTIRGQSPDLCVSKAFHAVEGEAAALQEGFRKIIREHMAADTRATMLQQSGFKFNAVSTQGFYNRVSGGDRQIAVDFPAYGYPDAAMTHKNLVRLNTHMIETGNVQPFGEGDGGYAVFVGSSELIEHMRDDSGLKTETLAFVQGADSAAKDAMRRFSFAEYPYRGIKTARDLRPLRFNLIDGDNFPVLIEPYQEVAADDGTRWAISNDWLTAKYEVSFLVYRNSFKRIVPARFTRAGDAVWEPQFAGGEIDWLNVKTRDCNAYGDIGNFFYQILVGWQATSPWSVCPIISKRCDWVDDMAPCTGVSEAD
jgi:hypothetical protein